MDFLFKMVSLCFLFLFIIMGASALFGYSCTSFNNVDDFSDTPCIPILSNGKANPHYRNSWYACTKTCILKGNPNLDVKTCECNCER